MKQMTEKKANGIETKKQEHEQKKKTFVRSQSLRSCVNKGKVKSIENDDT